jgi:hypothetical protein
MNPLLDTSLYDVEFEDGLIESYAANLIAEGIYAQVDDEGYQYDLISEIVDHRKGPDALTNENCHFVANGKKEQKRSTKGWELCVAWKDGSTSWVKLSDLKESDPLKVAEYATANKLDQEPAFVWWVPFVLKKKSRIIAKFKSRYHRREEKFGIPLPKSVKEALALDEESNTTYWRDAIRKEMGVILPALKIMNKGERAPVGYQQIPCHVVFDVKIDFTRKARFVAGGHVTAPQQHKHTRAWYLVIA